MIHPATQAAGGWTVEHCHNIKSVCVQNVRLLALRGDQLDPAYLKLNPNGVVPTPVQRPKLEMLPRAT